ncbi:HAD family hydrolase, partial [Vibrio parahaemolyticus]|nr:HAD family hydrolase [Vibrio parahaemolyticus]
MPSCLVHHGNQETFNDSASLALNELSDLLSHFQSLPRK